jgi:hypothetical protein
MMGSAPADKMPSAGEPRSARLNVAALRRAVPVRMWGGKGSAAPCDFCRVIVGPSDVEYEVEAQLDGATVTLHFHPRCHDAWTAGQEPVLPQTPAPLPSPDAA